MLEEVSHIISMRTQWLPTSQELESMSITDLPLTQKPTMHPTQSLSITCLCKLQRLGYMGAIINFNKKYHAPVLTHNQLPSNFHKSSHLSFTTSLYTEMFITSKPVEILRANTNELQ